MKLNDFGKWQTIIDKIKFVAVKNNLDTYIVGGFVRDLILKKDCKDLDLMVDGDGNGMRLAELIAKEYLTHDPVLFPKFGTAKITLDNESLEFVAPRVELYEKNNRKPETAKGSLFQDAMRRDLSVNALFININTGELLDLTGNGLDDIVNKTLRVTDPENADLIFEQDGLRLLRVIRFASQLEFSIEEKTYAAIIKNAEKLNTISRERIAEELNKILLTNKPSIALSLLKEAGLLKYISTHLDNLETTEDNPDNNTKNVWTHTLKVVDQAPKVLDTRLAALFHDVAKPLTKSRTYETICDSCGQKNDYNYKNQKEIKVVCEKCNAAETFINEQDLAFKFPSPAIHFYDHDKVGANIAKKFLFDFRYSQDTIDKISTLVFGHMKPHAYSENTWSDSACRRLSRESYPYLQPLLDLAQADVTSKLPEKRKFKVDCIEHLRNRIKDLETVLPNSLIKSPLDGNELMALYPDKKPGPWLSTYKEMLINEIIEGKLVPGDKENAKIFVDKLNMGETNGKQQLTNNIGA